MTGKLPVFNIERFAIHDGEGIRTAVFLQGCQLRCPWCANPESQTVEEKLMFLRQKCAGCGTCIPNCPKKAIALCDHKAQINRSACIRCGACVRACPNSAMQISGKWMTNQEILDVVLRDSAYYQQTHGGLTLSGGEALLHVDRLTPLLKACHEAGISVAFETCGHVPAENIRKALPWTTQFLYDIKCMDAEKFRRFTGGELSLVLDNLRIIAKQAPDKIVIRVPVIPSFNHSAQDMKEIFVLAVENHISRVDLLPYHTLGMTKYEQLGKEYPFSERTSLKPNELQPYTQMGKGMGLEVRIGG